MKHTVRLTKHELVHLRDLCADDLASERRMQAAGVRSTRSALQCLEVLQGLVEKLTALVETPTTAKAKA
jgi:hypothetical protein